MAMPGTDDATILRAQLYLRGDEPQHDIPLAADVRIGREQDCDLRIDDKRISRYHARIVQSGSGWMLEDLHSTNGTYINGVRVDCPQLLGVGDELRFHHCRYRLVSERSADLDATVYGEFIPATNAPPQQLAPCRDAAYSHLDSASAAAPLSAPPAPSQGRAEKHGLASDDKPLSARKPRTRPTAIERQLQRQQQQLQYYLERTDQLAEGCWFDMLEPATGRHYYSKLIARSTCRNRFRFRIQGGHLVEMGRDELARALHENVACPLERGPLLARLTCVMASVMRRDACRDWDPQGAI